MVELTEDEGYESGEEVANEVESSLVGKVKCSTTRSAGTDGSEHCVKNRACPGQSAEECCLKRVSCSSRVTNAGEMRIEVPLDTAIGRN